MTYQNSFSAALEAAKQGKAIQRQGWNGNGLKVRIQFPRSGSEMTLPYFYIEYPLDAKNNAGARGSWVPSQTDLLADDWGIF